MPNTAQTAAHLVKVAEAARQIKTAQGGWLERLKGMLSQDNIAALLRDNPSVVPTLVGAGIGGAGGALLGRRGRRWHELLRDTALGAGAGAGLGYLGHRLWQPDGLPDPQEAATKANWPTGTSSATLGAASSYPTLIRPVADRFSKPEAVASANPYHLREGINAAMHNDKLLPDDMKRLYQRLGAAPTSFTQQLLLHGRQQSGTAGVTNPIRFWQQGDRWSLSPIAGVEPSEITPERLAELTRGAQGPLSGERVIPGSIATGQRFQPFVESAGYKFNPDSNSFSELPGLRNQFRRMLDRSPLLASPNATRAMTAGRFALPAAVAAIPWLYARSQGQDLPPQ